MSFAFIDAWKEVWPVEFLCDGPLWGLKCELWGLNHDLIYELF